MDCFVALPCAFRRGMTKKNKEKKKMSDRLKGKRAFVTAAAVGNRPRLCGGFCA